MAAATRLNTQQAGSFYEWLAVERAQEMKNKFVFHYTPKHGSWINMAEPGGRSHRILCSGQTVFRSPNCYPGNFREGSAGLDPSNEKKVKINWLFDAPKARTKFKRHCVKLNPKNNIIIP
jgi:hypothetical protein